MINLRSMSKKRKTRRQKELAIKRHIHYSESANITSYSVEKPKKELKTTISNNKNLFKNEDMLYLRKDMISIGFASGIVVAFNILLFTILATGVVRLNFLGY